MSITDELRTWMYGHTVNCSDNRIALVAIADRIDAEHQKALDEWKAEHGQMWLKGYSECHAELMEGNEALASDLERCGWVRLPLDADGVPIHIGDVVESVAEGVRGIVGRIQYWVDMHGDMQARIMAHLLDASGAYWYDREEVRHYRPPTVEDMLREFAEKVIDSQIPDVHPTYEEAIAEYAKRLRLAGEGE